MSYVTEGLPSEHSPAEKRLYDIAQVEHRLPGWVFNHHLCLDGIHMYVDLAYPGVKIALEIDGYQHTAYDHVIRDGERDDLLRRNGWTVTRWDHSRALREPYDLIDWAERAVLEIPAARRDAETKRALNQLNAARRKVTDLVKRVVEHEVAYGHTAEAHAGLRTKQYNIQLKKQYGAAHERTLEAHQLAYERLSEYFESMLRKDAEAEERAAKAEALRIEEERQLMYDRWCENCATYHDSEDWDEERAEEIATVLTRWPGSTWPEIKDEINSNRDPRNKNEGTSLDGGCIYDDSYSFWEVLVDTFDARPMPGGDSSDDTTRWYTA